MGVEETLACPLGSPEWSTEGKGNYYFFYEKACDKVPVKSDKVVKRGY